MISFQPDGRIHMGFFGYAPVDQSSLLVLVTRRNDTSAFNLWQLHCWVQPRVLAVDVAVRQMQRGRPLLHVHDQPARNHRDQQHLCSVTTLDDAVTQLLAQARIVQVQGYRAGGRRVLCYTYTHPLRLDLQGCRHIPQVVPDANGHDGLLPRHPLLWDARWTLPGRPDHQDRTALLRIFSHTAAPLKRATGAGVLHE